MMCSNCLMTFPLYLKRMLKLGVHHTCTIEKSWPTQYQVCTLSNSPDCKRQLSRRHLLADSGVDQMAQ